MLFSFIFLLFDNKEAEIDNIFFYRELYIFLFSKSCSIQNSISSDFNNSTLSAKVKCILLVTAECGFVSVNWLEHHVVLITHAELQASKKLPNKPSCWQVQRLCLISAGHDSTTLVFTLKAVQCILGARRIIVKFLKLLLLCALTFTYRKLTSTAHGNLSLIIDTFFTCFYLFSFTSFT